MFIKKKNYLSLTNTSNEPQFATFINYFAIRTLKYVDPITTTMVGI